MIFGLSSAFFGYGGVSVEIDEKIFIFDVESMKLNVDLLYFT